MPDRVLPDSILKYLPPKAERVICHWTAGAYRPSGLDLEHYHVVFDGSGVPYAGRYIGRYGPPNHTRMLNSGSIGLSAACMAGARQSPFHAGAFPLKEVQWERMAQAAAEVLHRYRLPVSERTVLFHSEAWRVYKRPQLGKWDINRLPWAPELTADEVHAQFRRKVAWYLGRIG